MNIDIKKLNPWNWFKHEGEDKARGVSVQRAGQGAVSTSLPSRLPANPLWDLHREVDRLFDNAWSQFGRGLPRMFDGGTLLKPDVNIKETKKSYEITVEVPGVDEGDVKLELANGALTVSGEKKHEKAKEEENYYCVERSYGSFCRVLALPSDGNEDGIEAKFRNGVLTITVPRKQMAKTKDETKVIDIKRAA